MLRTATLLLLFATLPARAEFALANLRFTLFHELGHAVIDQARVPIFGPEENAADSFAIVLAHRVLEEEEMVAMIVGMTHLGQAEAAVESFDPWAEYMPGGQRTARALCIWYGLAPDRRGDIARALGMPPARAEDCEEAAEAMRAAWDPVLNDLAAGPEPGQGGLVPAGDGKALRLLADDIKRVNATLSLPAPTSVTVEPCGEDNAFYYPSDDAIVLCTEMMQVLGDR